MRIAISKCKSDPERLLAKILNEVADEEWPPGWTVDAQAKSTVFQERQSGKETRYDLHVDFLFESVPTEKDPLKPFMRVAVECDSLAYHDLKSEQIEKDRWRDRKLAGYGIFVLRYSATHILRDPKGVADEILLNLECLSDWLDPLHWLVDWGSPVSGIERYLHVVTARLEEMIDRVRKAALRHGEKGK